MSPDKVVYTDVRLDPDRIVETVRGVKTRIDEGFPGSGLGGLGAHLVEIAEGTRARIDRARRANLPLRLAIAFVVIALPLGTVALIFTAHLPAQAGDLFQYLEGLEAGFNGVILMGAAILFLVTLENRLSRRRVLYALRDLRALAHIVDMHQLSKDPSGVIIHGAPGLDGTPAGLSHHDLVKYLDLCSDLLAIVSKIAALYAQAFDDPVVLGAVDEVESLTTGLASKIWQKIMILDQATS